MTDSGAGESVASAPGERLPDGWVRARIGDLCDVNPRAFDEEPGDDDLISQVPMAFVEAESGRMDASTQVRFGDFKKKSLTRFQDDDVLFAKITPCMENGKIAKAQGLAGGRALGSTEFHVLRSTGGVLPEYLMHYLLQRNVRRVAERHMSGAVGQRRVPRPYLTDLEIPVPPLPEQRRIVAKLDEQLGRIEDGESALVEAGRQLELFEVMLLAKATKANPEASSWECFAIGEMANVSSGATPLKARSDYYQHGTVPWVTSSLLNDSYIDSADKFITDLALSETAVKEYPPGTILMAMYGEGKTRGKCAVLGIRATTNQACAGIELKPEYESSREWVLALLEALYEENRELASGGVQPNLNLGLIKKIRVPLPPVVRQKEILTELAERRSEAAAMREVIKDASAQAKSLRGALLHAAFTGVLVPQDPADEPADALVDRIRTQRQTAAVKPVRKRAPRKTISKPASSGQEELSL